MAEHLNLLPVALLLIGAVAGGLLLAGLRQPPLVGYIVAGAVFGPSGLGLITDRLTIDVFAELGVLVLLFVVGTHLSLRGFKSIYRTAVGAAALQILVSVSLMLVLGHLLGWRAERAVLYGFVLALSSTAVGIKILEDVGELRNETGRVAVGVLIAQDLAVVPMLIVVVGMARPEGVDLPALLLKLALAVAALIALIWFLSRRQRTHLPFRRLWVRHPDLAPIGALALMRDRRRGERRARALRRARRLPRRALRRQHHRARGHGARHGPDPEPAADDVLPLGRAADRPRLRPGSNLATVLLLIGFVFLLNSVINVGALRAVGAPWRVAFLAGFALAQVGEFAFVLAAAGVASGLIGEEAQRVVVAVIALTMVASPLWLGLARRLHALQAAPPQRLSLLLARLARDEARILKLRSARLVQGGALLAANLGRRIDQVIERYRGPRHRAAARTLAEPPGGQPP